MVAESPFDFKAKDPSAVTFAALELDRRLILFPGFL
jgi:hypothetical protein